MQRPRCVLCIRGLQKSHWSRGQEKFDRAEIVAGTTCNGFKYTKLDKCLPFVKGMCMPWLGEVMSAEELVRKRSDTWFGDGNDLWVETYVCHGELLPGRAYGSVIRAIWNIIPRGLLPLFVFAMEVT